MGRNYSRKENPASSDLSLIWDNANSDWKLSPFSAIANLMQSLLTSLSNTVKEPVSQYLNPLDGFSVTLEGEEDIHLFLSPLSTLSSGSVVLPLSPGTRDKQVVTVTTTEEITSLTVNGNGATLIGEPTTLLAEGYFTMKYDMQTNAWYRVA